MGLLSQVGFSNLFVEASLKSGRELGTAGIEPATLALEIRGKKMRHHQERMDLILVDVVGGTDVRVVERRGGERLAAKAR
jgi:hypothetical protein